MSPKSAKTADDHVMKMRTPQFSSLLVQGSLVLPGAYVAGEKMPWLT
jgi:hypothetical protein